MKLLGEGQSQRTNIRSHPRKDFRVINHESNGRKQQICDDLFTSSNIGRNLHPLQPCWAGSHFISYVLYRMLTCCIPYSGESVQEMSSNSFVHDGCEKIHATPSKTLNYSRQLLLRMLKRKKNCASVRIILHSTSTRKCLLPVNMVRPDSLAFSITKFARFTYAFKMTHVCTNNGS